MVLPEFSEMNQIADLPNEHLGWPAGFGVVRAHAAFMIDRALDKLGAEEALATPERRMEFIQGQTPESFNATLLGISGLALNIPRGARRFSDNFQTSIIDGDRSSWVFPAPEDKTTLLKELLVGIKAQPDLGNAALLTAVGLNAIHPFIDGNGRIARLAYHLLNNGYKPTDPRQTHILMDHGANIFNPSTAPLHRPLMGGVALKLGSHFMENSEVVEKIRGILGAHAGRDGSRRHLIGKLPDAAIDDETKGMLFGVFNEPFLRQIVPWAIFKDPKYRQHFVTVPDKQGGTALNFDSLTEALDPELINKIYQTYRRAKVGFVRGLIKGFVKPASNTLQVGMPDGSVRTQTIPEYLYLKSHHLI